MELINGFVGLILIIGLELHPPMVGKYHHVDAVKSHLLRF